MLCLSTEELFLLNQESENVIHKGPDNKHLRLYGPYDLCHAIHFCHCNVKAAIDRKQMNEVAKFL